MPCGAGRFDQGLDDPGVRFHLAPANQAGGGFDFEERVVLRGLAGGRRRRGGLQHIAGDSFDSHAVINFTIHLKHIFNDCLMSR